MYNIDFDPAAIEFLEKSEKIISKRIWDKIISTKDNPHHFFERLEKRSDYKIRIGDYRAIADINDKNKNIQVTLIGHRKNIYKKLK